ncbi:hypothetical protein [Rhodococcoides fascians]|nr:hypothetical protein [Rhodococcus fascians]
MSKRSERAAYRAEVLAELRALVAVGRRIAAVAERNQAANAVEYGEPER